MPLSIARLMRFLRNGIVWYIVLLVFLAPVKFGGILYSGTLGNFPLSLMEWFVAPWPPSLMAGLCGIALIGTATLFPVPAVKSNNAFWLPVLAWAILPLGTLPGLAGTAELDRGLLFFWNLLTALSLAVAVLLVLANRPRTATPILAALVCGTFIAAASAWSQVPGGGLQRTLELAEEMADETGEELHPYLRRRLLEGRAFGTFFYPNALAGHVILTLPLCLAALWYWCGRVSPPTLTRAIFLPIAAVFGGLALMWTGSRAAFAALGGGLIVAGFFTRMPRLWRAVLAIAAAVAVLGGILAVNRGRSLSSLEARINYWGAAADMAVEHPVTGVGLGAFFPEFARRLEPGEELARQPHNFWLLFAAESGVAGLLAATFLLSMPFWLRQQMLDPRRTSEDRPRAGLSSAMFVFAAHSGVTAWLLHSLTDQNFHVPGTLATAALLPVLGVTLSVRPAGEADPAPPKNLRIRQSALAALGIVTLLGSWRLPGDYSHQKLINAYAGRRMHTSQLAALARTAARRLPSSPYPWLLLAQAAENKGQLEIAATALRNALERAPHRGTVWHRLARVETRQGNHKAAREAFRNADKWGSGREQAGGKMQDHKAGRMKNES